MDRLFGYDELNRLTSFKTGQLNTGGDAITSPTMTQAFTLDETGNLAGFTQTLVNAVTQTRDHNKANEITDISESVGKPWATPAHDVAGNMTSIPQPADLSSNYDATWDAWNRLVELSDSGDVVSRYWYDGSNRRIVVAAASVAGIEVGFVESDLVFTPNQWDGAPNPGEFGVVGTYFKTGPDSGDQVNVGTLGSGIGVIDAATGTGYIMYSATDVHTRFTVHASNADHLVAVRLNGTQWQYNTNLAWVDFTPVATDRLLPQLISATTR